MAKVKMNRGITLEILDWNNDGTRRIFGSADDVGYFWLHLYYANGTPSHISESTFDSAFMKEGAVKGTAIKPTSKMNVMVRGRDGKFISYRKLQNTDVHVAYEAIDELPNI